VIFAVPVWGELAASPGTPIEPTGTDRREPKGYNLPDVVESPHSLSPKHRRRHPAATSDARRVTPRSNNPLDKSP
jgi:hypothetical protein